MELKQYLTLVRRNWWVLLLGSLLAASAAYLYAGRLPRLYQAQSTLLLNLAEQPTQPSSDNITASQSLTKTYVRIITADETLKAAATRLGGGVTATDLGPISPSITTDTSLMVLSFTGRDPVFAGRAVNAVAQVFAERVRLAQLGDAGADATVTPRTSINSIFIVDPASAGSLLPSRRALYTELAALAGLAVAFGGLLLLEYLDDKVSNREAVEAAGLPLLGVVPRVRRTGVRLSVLSPEHARGFFAEGYHQIRTNLDFLAHQQGLRSLLVTSTAPGEGKTTVACNLAILFAGVGRSVILVDGDLRRPTVHRFFGLSNEAGLATALGRAELDLHTLLRPSTTIPGLSVMTAGPTPHNPVELLSSARLGSIAARLRLLADVVIFDSAPVVALADASLIATHVDSVLMVVASGQTQAGALKIALDNIGRSAGNVLGAVLNSVTRETGTGYDYYYKYTGRYGYVPRKGGYTADAATAETAEPVA